MIHTLNRGWLRNASGDESHPKRVRSELLCETEVSGVKNKLSSIGPSSGPKMAGVVRKKPPVGASASQVQGVPLPRLAYRVNEVAEMLGVSEKTVRRLIARGLLRPSKALRHHLIPRSQVEEFLTTTP